MNEHVDVAVVGAGLAGLAAAATAARAGSRVVVLEHHPLGGRARTTERGGFRFNLGPRAIYLGGSGRAVLERFGIDLPGGPPALDQARALTGDELHVLPVGPAGLAATRLLGLRDKGQLARVMRGLGKVEPEPWASASTEDWLAALDLRPAVEALLRTTLRVSTYTAELAALPADVAISQLRMGQESGVRYLDGGWQRLVDGLAAAASRAGAAFRRAAVDGIEPGVRSHRLRLVPAAGEGGAPGHGGRTLVADAVVIAAGGPRAAAGLLPDRPAWSLGPAVTAACLDLGLRRPPRPPILFGVDRPLYLSTHCPPADLAARGGAVVHAMRYLTSADDVVQASELRAELEAFAARAGVADGDIATSRFLGRMVVVSALPPLGAGRRGRPTIEASGWPGVLLAGDWVGPDGFLADASLVSGEAAGRTAAAHIRRHTTALVGGRP